MRLLAEHQQRPQYASEFSTTERLNTWPHVVFQCKFDGANLATTAIDESLIAAPLTFHGSAIISTDVGGTTGAPAGAATGTLKFTTPGGYVDAPANDAYNIGGEREDFTVELWMRRGAGDLPWPVHFVGVWDETDINKQSWRIIGDNTNRLFFMWREGGATRSVLTTQSQFFTNSGSWFYFGVQRMFSKAAGGQFVFPPKLFMFPAAPQLIDRTFGGVIDPPVDPTPLRIGGSNILTAPGTSAAIYIAYVRITKAGQYPAELLVGQQFNSPWGIVKPALVSSTDAFSVPVVTTQPLPGLVAHDDQIHAATVSWNRTLTPAKVTDADTFHVAPLLFPPNVISANFPRVTNSTFRPRIISDVVTTGYGKIATPDLPAGLVNGNLLLAIIHTKKTLRHFFVDGQEIAIFNNPQLLGVNEWFCNTGGFYAVTGISAWAYRYIDDEIEPPVITWPDDDPSYWTMHVLQIEGVEQQEPTCGGVVAIAGDGSKANSLFDDGLFGCGPASMVLCITTANTDQVIPVPFAHETFVQYSGEHGSHTISMVNTQEPNGNQGSGEYTLTIERADWSITQFQFTGPFEAFWRLRPPSPNLLQTMWLQARDTFHAPTVTQS